MSQCDAQIRDRSLYYTSSRLNDERPCLVVEHVNKLFDVVDFPQLLSETFDKCPLGDNGMCLRWSYHQNLPIAVRLSTIRNFLSDIEFDEERTRDMSSYDCGTC